MRETNLVDGKWLGTSNKLDIHDPANGAVVGQIDYGNANMAAQACDAAEAAFKHWSNISPRQRADHLLAGASELAKDTKEIAHTLALEAGKRISESIGEVQGAVEYFRWFAEEARRPIGFLYPNEQDGRRHLSVAKPAGVAACLTPWNFPISIQARKIAPALAAGCTVVARASEKAPLAVVMMYRALQRAGLPAGVLNLVHGPADEITHAYLDHPAVRVVSFTGSTEVGRSILKTASNRIVRPLMELGGSAPFIVFNDADIDLAVTTAMIAKFRNNGQSCIAANKFIVQRKIFEEFSTRLAKRIDEMTLGSGVADPEPDLGPCIDTHRVDAVMSMVTEALDKGARQLTRNFILPEEGSFCAPAIFVDVPDDCALNREEIFGPVASLVSFDDEDEAIMKANSSELGLASYAMTNDQGRIWRLSKQIDTGIMGVNDPSPTTAFIPMGGTKQSGLGREGGRQGLEEFQEIQYIAQRF